MYKVVLLRHGQSTWNLENRFTGWTDVGLTDQGRAEALTAGKQLKDEGYEFDIAYTSVLRRAIQTLWIVLEQMQLEWIPVVNAWELNERHYGALQGLNKAETAKKFGDAQVKLWRRSYDVPPPALELTDERHPRFDPRYASLKPDQIPATESLKITLERVLPYWHSVLAPRSRAAGACWWQRTAIACGRWSSIWMVFPMPTSPSSIFRPAYRSCTSWMLI